MNESASYKSYAEYARLGYTENCVVESRLEGTQGISLVKAVQGSGAYPDPAIPDFCISYGKRTDQVGRYNLGDGYFDVKAKSGAFIVAPADVATYCEYDGFLELYAIGIPRYWVTTLVEGITRKPFHNFGRLHSSLQTDKSIAKLVEQLHHPDTLEANNALLVDGLSMALVGKLVTLSRHQHKPREVPALEKSLLTRVQNYLEQRLAENPTLEDLAAVTGMNVYEFAKRFKIATGFSPYQYVLAQRLEHAKELLEHSQLSLSEVAYSVGFSSQAHMNKIFKERLGLTPKLYRKDLS
jgi:AraC family transcriptional regulator